MANLKNALGGAASGAAAGSAIFPGIGTAIGGLLGGIGGLFGGGDDTMDLLKKNQQMYGDIKAPDFGSYTPGQYNYVGDYNPEAAQATTVTEDPTGRNAQVSAMMKMAGLAQNGLSDVDSLGYQNARNLASQISHSGTAAALNNAQSRGAGGSGMEFMMREQAAQDAAGQAQQAALQQAADSARQRAMYTQALGSQASQLRGQDYNAQANNANVLNQFAQYNTGAKNQAQQQNLANRQGIGNANVSNANAAQQYNNQMKQQTYQDQMQKAGAMSGANTDLGRGYAAQDAAGQSSMNSGFGALAHSLMPSSVKKKEADYSEADGYGGGIKY